MRVELFPERGLDHSLLTVVLLGLYVRFAFTEWLGWGFSGLVVPGYLAAVACVRPVSLLVVVVEAMLTLGLVRGLALLLARLHMGTTPFGRDRFIWIIAASVAVRTAVEGLVAPPFYAALREHWGAAADPTGGNGFYGVGLVLVPLLANSFWKPGLLRGLGQTLVTTSITYALLRLLLATTNLSLASLSLSFERLALDFTASPKAYILMLAAALIASRFNLRFGWDTSGVLIPALLCIGWFAPTRVLATTAEAFVIALAAALFTALPGVREWNVEGPRRVVLVFSLGYLIKFLVVSGLGYTPYQANDLFGIGYLLPSLLAVKIWQKRSSALVLLPAVALSLAGLFVGTLAGFGIGVMEEAIRPPPIMPPTSGSLCAEAVSTRHELWLARARLANTPPSDTAPRITPEESRRFAGLVAAMASRRDVAECAALGLSEAARALGLRLTEGTAPSGRGYWLLAEANDDHPPARGFGMVAIARGHHGGPTLVAAHPDRQFYDADVLMALADLTRAGALVVDGIGQLGVRRADSLADSDAPLRVAVRAIAQPALIVELTPDADPKLSSLAPSDVRATLATRFGTLGPAGTAGWASVFKLPTRATAALTAPFRLPPLAYDSLGAWLLPRPRPEREAPSAALTIEERGLLMELVMRPLLGHLGVPDGLAAIAAAADVLGCDFGRVSGVPKGVVLSPRLGAGLEGLVRIDLDRNNDWVVEVATTRPGARWLGERLARGLGARALIIDGTLPGGGALAGAARVAAALAVHPPRYLIVRADDQLEKEARLRPHRDQGGSGTAQLAKVAATLGLTIAAADPYLDSDAGGAIERLVAATLAPYYTLALAPATIESFGELQLSAAETALAARLEIPAKTVDLAALLQSRCHDTGGASPSPALVALARSYAEGRNAALLPRLRDRARTETVPVSLAIDRERGRTYLVLGAGSKTLLLALAKSATATPPSALRCGSGLAAELTTLLDRRVGGLRLEAGR